jgi:hypothetical protein
LEETEGMLSCELNCGTVGTQAVGIQAVVALVVADAARLRFMSAWMLLGRAMLESTRTDARRRKD